VRAAVHGGEFFLTLVGSFVCVCGWRDRTRLTFPAPTTTEKPTKNQPKKKAYELRGAGAVIHSHSPASVLATMLDPSADTFTVTHLEMIKGIEGHGFYGECVVPIIENTARECELTGRMRDAIARFPRANAVLVRRHGVYVWGRDWVQAKTQAECYDYLFDAAVRMAGLGIDASRPPAPLPLPASEAAAANGNGNGNGACADADADAPPAAKRPRPPASSGPLAAAAHGAAPRPLGPNRRRLPKAVVLDIEGTVSPLAFVAETMRPYCSAERLRAHFEAHYGSEQTRADLELVRQQAQEDAAGADGGGASKPFPDPATAPREEVVAAAVAWASAASAADRKVPALKALQGRVWRGGFERGDLVAQLFRDVPDALAEWRDSLGIKTYIYSSGSREAQRLFFAHTQVGDLRPYLCGFFDPAAVGPKWDARSYEQIQATVGYDDARADLVFATDAVAEAEAARAAGWRAVLVAREGNPPLEAGAAAAFPVVTTMAELLEAAAKA
jgi:methylthioribulose 1-phosphate dehydratase/enolase-phosphatase E1